MLDRGFRQSSLISKTHTLYIRNTLGSDRDISCGGEGGCGAVVVTGITVVVVKEVVELW